MKKYLSLLTLLTLLTNCNPPGTRSWIIPVTIDPSDLSYTPAQMESFELRRKEVLSLMKEGFVVLKSSDQGSICPNGFRPNPYFYYLTGYDAPGSFAVLSGSDSLPFTFSMPRQRIRTLIYEGETLPEKAVREHFRPDRLLSHSDFMVFLDSILLSGEPIYMDRSDHLFYQELLDRAENDATVDFRNVAALVDELRVIKAPHEVERLQKACNITSRAITNVMRDCVSGKYEFEMESIIEGTFLEYGSSMPGFPSIVGSGPNSTILHYEQNDRLMEDGDLLLMDIGAEYGYYTADITRTVPVNGRFSKEQRIIYQLVLDAQKAAIDSLRPGMPMGSGHAVAREILIRGLVGLGLITDSTSTWQSRFYVLYPSSHYLGLDVHDVGNDGGFFRYFRGGCPGSETWWTDCWNRVWY